ncbi:hypothetical protein AAC387_Pa09g1888 [Persea americana]
MTHPLIMSWGPKVGLAPPSLLRAGDPRRGQGSRPRLAPPCLRLLVGRSCLLLWLRGGRPSRQFWGGRWPRQTAPPIPRWSQR